MQHPGAGAHRGNNFRTGERSGLRTSQKHNKTKQNTKNFSPAAGNNKRAPGTSEFLHPALAGPQRVYEALCLRRHRSPFGPRHCRRRAVGGRGRGAGGGDGCGGGRGVAAAAAAAVAAVLAGLRVGVLLLKLPTSLLPTANLPPPHRGPSPLRGQTAVCCVTRALSVDNTRDRRARLSRLAIL